jgi:hypothetical protein
VPIAAATAAAAAAAAAAVAAAETAAAAATARATPVETPAVVVVRTPPGISIWLGKRFILGDICSCSKGVEGAGRKVGRCRHVTHRVRMASSVSKNSQEMPQKFRNTCYDELHPGRLTHELVWVDQTKHLIQSRTEVAFRCHSFTIGELSSYILAQEFVHGVPKMKVCADEVIFRFQRTRLLRMKIDETGGQNDLERLICEVVLNVAIFVYDCPEFSPRLMVRRLYMAGIIFCPEKLQISIQFNFFQVTYHQ